MVARLSLLQGDRGIDAVVERHNRTGQQDQQPAVRHHEAELPPLPGKADRAWPRGCSRPASPARPRTRSGCRSTSGRSPAPCRTRQRSPRRGSRPARTISVTANFSEARRRKTAFGQFQQDRNYRACGECVLQVECRLQCVGQFLRPRDRSESGRGSKHHFSVCSTPPSRVDWRMIPFRFIRCRNNRQINR